MGLDTKQIAFLFQKNTHHHHQVVSYQSCHQFLEYQMCYSGLFDWWKGYYYCKWSLINLVYIMPTLFHSSSYSSSVGCSQWYLHRSAIHFDAFLYFFRCKLHILFCCNSNIAKHFGRKFPFRWSKVIMQVSCSSSFSIYHHKPTFPILFGIQWVEICDVSTTRTSWQKTHFCVLHIYLPSAWWTRYKCNCQLHTFSHQNSRIDYT